MPHDIHARAQPQARSPNPGRRPAPRPDPCAPACKPECPACGGLECLCRPRFFPGQLLTDEDLNRLERYVVEKNKLHNRYLEGWGVACGLEVICDACDSDRVVVRTGYALSPCGDDIVVCEDASVNVCELIDACRTSRDPVCDPPRHEPPRECRDGQAKWVLAICYDERPSRGITALLGASDTACCAACGGSGGGCGCNGGGAKPKPGEGCAGSRASTKRATRPAQAQCEPTLICEGHRFVAYPYVPPSKDLKGAYMPDANARTTTQDLMFAWMYANRARFGPLLERLLCCLTRALELRATWREGRTVDAKTALQVYDEYLEALREFAVDFGVHRCGVLATLDVHIQANTASLQPLRSMGSLGTPHVTVVQGALDRLDNAWLGLVGECFCSAMLPACPEPATSNCVPLAVVTLRANDCRVVEICNWEARKILLNWRTIGYWLSWLPWHRLKEAIAKLCCTEGRERNVFWMLLLVILVVMSGSRAKSGIAEARVGATGPGAAAGGVRENLERERMADMLHADNFMAALAGGADDLLGGRDRVPPAWTAILAQLAAGRIDPAALGAAAPADAGLEARVAELERTTAAYRGAMEGFAAFLRPRGEGD